jgi:hypothetical protein
MAVRKNRPNFVKMLDMSRGLLTIVLLFFLLFFHGSPGLAQCSICTRTTEQLGEKPAAALNAGILYLAITPLAIAGYIGYRWWKSNHEAK